MIISRLQKKKYYVHAGFCFTGKQNIKICCKSHHVFKALLFGSHFGVSKFDEIQSIHYY